MATQQSGGHALSRRSILKIMAGSSAGLAGSSLLAGCGQDEESSSSDSGPTGGPSGGGSISVAIPQSVPEDEAFYTEWFQTFTEDTGIEVIPRFYPDGQYAEAIQLLFQSGDEPDVLRLVKPPAQMPAAFDKGWIRPLNEFSVITEALEEFYPESAMDPNLSGMHMGDELYGVPGPMHKQLSFARPLMANTRLLAEHGIGEVPTSYSDVRAAAQAVTEGSGGSSYGFVVVGQASPDVKFMSFQATAGAPLDAVPVSFKTGRSGASDESVATAADFLRGIVEDGSMAPGWQTMGVPAFFQAFAQEQVAMVVIPAWWVAEIRKINPDLDLEFVTQPVPDSGREGYSASLFNPGAFAPQWGVTQASSNPDAAARLVAAMASMDVQRQYYEKTQVVPALGDSFVDELSEDHQRMIQVSGETTREAPNPRVRNDASFDVLTAVRQKAPSPSLEEIIFSAVDEGADLGELAETYDAALNEVLDSEIEAASDQGVSQDTFAFPDWDPLEDYVTEPA